jgi:exosortase E/protease (VPEID-CTERM system)
MKSRRNDLNQLFYKYTLHVPETSAATTSAPGYRPGLPLRLIIIALVFFAEKIFLNRFVDFERADAAVGLGAFVRESQHWGFRFLVASAAAIALFAYVRDGQKLLSAKAAMRSTPIRVGWVLLHLALIACLVPLTSRLFPDSTALLPFGALVALWVLLGLGAAVSAFLAMAPWPLWVNAAQALGIIWCYAGIAALLGACAMQLSQRLWIPTTAVTFDLVHLLLLPVMPGLRADAATRVLSTGRFAVEVSEVCSGLEGMGLTLAFTAAWLLYFRREYIFPRSLLLIPIGLLMIFALNILRIAALMLIGDAGFPGVAVYGFHSQAGWLAFNGVACALIFFSHRSAWLNRTAATRSAAESTENPTAAYLMPFLAILAAGVLSRAISSGFENAYALRLVAGMGFLVLYRRRLAALDWRWSWRGPAVGVASFLLWIVVAHFQLPAAAMPRELTAMPAALRETWIACRLGISVLVVPIAEELAYRGYLMRRLINPDFESVPYQSVRWGAIAVTSVVFGLAHGAMWLPGIATGMAYGMLAVRRGTIGEAVVAHATTNALVATAVLIWTQWQLW